MNTTWVDHLSTIYGGRDIGIFNWYSHGEPHEPVTITFYFLNFSGGPPEPLPGSGGSRHYMQNKNTYNSRTIGKRGMIDPTFCSTKIGDYTRLC